MPKRTTKGRDSMDKRKKEQSIEQLLERWEVNTQKIFAELEQDEHSHQLVKKLKKPKKKRKGGCGHFRVRV